MRTLPSRGWSGLSAIELDVTDDFGQPGHRTLVLEAMGRRSNLILLDGEGRIIDCMRRVDVEMSAQRQVLPGLFYEQPASTGVCRFWRKPRRALMSIWQMCRRKPNLTAFCWTPILGSRP